MAADVSLFRASDGYEFYLHRFQPTGTIVARVVVLHGIRSHAGWYGSSCQKLADDGYDVHFLDRRGSGWNTARRGDCPSCHRLIDDVAEFILDLRRTRAGLPMFLVGISWGGKLAVALAARYSTIFSVNVCTNIFIDMLFMNTVTSHRTIDIISRTPRSI